MDERAVQIVEKVSGAYVLKEDALSRILRQESVLNKKVAVLTVAGAFRKGKSFFLSNCVRYLQRKRDGGDWMAPSAPVTGFTWRQSADPVTDGILMWPEPFIVKTANGEEVAVLLMDTEGAFDSKSSVKQCATVFALSALLSSVLVYNVIQDVQEDTLQHLQFFASYGSFALNSGENSSPFQSLLFLVRDWQNDNEFGLEAGRRHLDEKLEYHSSRDLSMEQLRRDIRRSFADIKCSLLPDPGRKITRGSEGVVKVQDMEPDFREQLLELIPRLFGNLLQAKEIGGQKIIGAEFLEFFKTYVKIFASGDVPEPKSVYQATSEATHQSALKNGLDLYVNSMKSKFSELSARQFFEDSKLRSIHQQLTNDAVNAYNQTKKIGNLPKFLDDLKDQIEAAFVDKFMKDNQHRAELERARNAKEEAERRMVEQDRRSRDELERKEREKEQIRLEMERERKRDREEAERRSQEYERRQKEEFERLIRQMEQIQLETERRDREREEDHRRQLEKERERATQAEREARASLSAQRMEYMSQQHSYEYQNFGGGYSSPSPSLCQPSSSRAGTPSSDRNGTPSGRPRGRPRGSVMERLAQGISPKEGTRDWVNLQKKGLLPEKK